MTDSRLVERQLSLARQALTPSAALRHRVHAGLTASGGGAQGAAGLALGQATRAKPWAALRATGTVGILVGFGLLTSGFAAGYLMQPGDPEPPPLPRAPLARAAIDATLERNTVTPAEPSHPSRDAATQEAAGTRGGEATPVELARAVVPRPHLPARHSTKTPAKAPAPAGDQLTLLQRAERAVRAHDPALALALTNEHAERYPRSALGEERQALELMAHCEAGASDAPERASEFLRVHAGSVYARRVRELCHPEPTSDRAPR